MIARSDVPRKRCRRSGHDFVAAGVVTDNEAAHQKRCGADGNRFIFAWATLRAAATGAPVRRWCPLALPRRGEEQYSLASEFASLPEGSRNSCGPPVVILAKTADAGINACLTYPVIQKNLKKSPRSHKGNVKTSGVGHLLWYAEDGWKFKDGPKCPPSKKALIASAHSVTIWPRQILGGLAIRHDGVIYQFPPPEVEGPSQTLPVVFMPFL
jgi:hypothetical protein